MATCDMGYEHTDPAPVVDASPAPVVVDQGPNEHDVEIAQIEAAASVEREKIYAQEADQELVAENERLRGKIAGMEEILARLAPPEPDPAPEPVVVPMPDPEPAPEDVPPPPEGDKPKSESSGGGWWDGYR